MKKDRLKNSIIEQLKKMPIVQIACERAGIGRATYYRWRNENKNFKKMADDAIAEGELLINDMSESQIISLIREKNWSAISFWLRHHHPKYTNKLEITGHLKHSEEELTLEEKGLIKKALRLALPPTNKHEEKKKINTQ